MTTPGELLTSDEIALNLDGRGQCCRVCGSRDVFEKQDGDALNHQCAISGDGKVSGRHWYPSDRCGSCGGKYHETGT